MAATGANRKERHLAQPPRGFLKAAPSHRGLHFPNWVAAVLLVAALVLALLPLTASEAQVTAPNTTEEQQITVPILFPLEHRVIWIDTFGAARSGGRTHAGNDLMAPKMTPILAVTDGTVDWLNLTGKVSSYNGLPYYNILLHGDDGNDYFYVHLNNDTPGTDDGLGGPETAYAPGLTNGSRVRTGDVIGYVGDSGNAEDCESHLHFEIHLGGYVSAGSGQTRSPSAIDPYPSLMAAPTLSEWQAAGCPPLATMVTATTVEDDETNTSGSTTTSQVSPTTTKPSTTTTKPSTTTTTGLAPGASGPGSTAPGGSAVPGFVDVKTTDWFYQDFVLAEQAGVVMPASDQRFRPYSKVDRALFASYLVRTVAPEALEGITSLGGPEEPGTFSDVSPGFWAYSEIEIAVVLGLVKGTGDGSTFSPDELVTRAQMAAMVYRAIKDLPRVASLLKHKETLPRFKDVPADHWAAEAIGAMQALGLICGDAEGRFRPLDNTTRAQAVTVMARIIRLLEEGEN